MKPQIILLILFISGLFTAQTASAQGLLMENCANGPTAPSFQQFLFTQSVGQSNGISCETIRSLNETISVVNLALLPAAALIRNPTVSASLAADLAAAGLTFSNPVVLGVTVVGSVGIATFYIVMRQSLEDCEQQEREALKQEILNELQNKYGAAAAPGVQLEIKK